MCSNPLPTAAYDPAALDADHHVSSVLRSSLDVELTYPAFRLPGVYDRKFESNFLHTNSDSDSPRHFHRVFHQHTAFPPNRKYSIFVDRGSSISGPSGPRSPLFRDEESEESGDSIGLHGGQQQQGASGSGASAASKAKKRGTGDLQLVGMGAIGGRHTVANAAAEARDNVDSYSIVRNIIFGNARRMNVSRLERKDINFSSIVDIDDEAFESYVSEDLAGRLGEGDFFRLVMLIVIILNSIMIGTQTDANMRNLYGPLFSILDAIFLSIFIMEILFKWYYAFANFWKSAWNWLDVALVIIALLGPLITFSQSSRILKMLRMIRAFRSLRSISALSGMYTVLQVVAKSIPDMLNITLLLLILMFIFAVVGVTLFGSVYPERFGDLGTALFFLFILVTQDGWVVLFDELEKRGQFTAGAIYCVIFITLGGFIFSNLIVAVVVTNLETTYENIKRQMKAKFRRLKSRAASQRKSGGSAVRAIATLAEGDEQAYLNQIPYELPEFDRITESKLENYYLLLMVIEENLKEYVQIKEQLNEILLELKVINENREEEIFDEQLANDEEEDFEELDTGDALTRLINMQSK
ncbi:Ion transport protein-domain-containing protein [Catenaria anguillulae PL171]|uniref:Ion transport protein-domain-containing protein n=1 Tax=Catenaria anguillulae PL171 TaxID=765915 RepID=A0A1Y2HCJ2_9FUNG|nr:Ion transport protein-domain-containing protein [Catenaria anguillulae PL171]